MLHKNNDRQNGPINHINALPYCVRWELDVSSV